MIDTGSYEKLGLFYLGSEDAGGAPLLYASRDLVTHGVIVGMTGSGKTGLGAVLLEEAAIDAIPVIAIDPKGDLANLALTFPELRAQDFAPWAPPGQDPAALAQRAREGLAASGQSPERIARFASAIERTIFTPGATHGVPLSVAGSLAPPRVDDEATSRERAIATVSALLGLVGVDADPLRSPEHTLLTGVLTHAWSRGEALTIPDLLRLVQQPPFDKLGAIDLETVMSAKDRQRLALAINNAFASPVFAGFLQGAPLDIDALLFDPNGRPRLSIVSIAHLDEAARMFFVTVLLGELVAWMRRQRGTESLRALIYMDEAFGFFPPVAAPPSKGPMLTLLKQARAFGLGVVLATQNPADLDYKALGNAGTWMIGRLQTDRDKARVLDALESAGGDRSALEARLASLPSRTFVLHDVHRDGPATFTTRWALSYLRGPLDREQIATLTTKAPATASPFTGGAAPTARPVLGAGVEELFLVRSDLAAPTALRPGVLVRLGVSYTLAKAGLDHGQSATLIAPLAASGPTWSDAWWLTGEPPLASAPPAGVPFAELPAAAARAESYREWAKLASAHVARDRPIVLGHIAALDLYSAPGETPEAFAARAQLLARERRDAEIAKLRAKHETKIERAKAKLERIDDRIAREKSQRLDSGISAGATVLGALFGRGSMVSGAARAARSASRVARQGDDVARAEQQRAKADDDLVELDADLREAIATISATWDPAKLATVACPVRAKKVEVERVALVWVPT